MECSVQAVNDQVVRNVKSNLKTLSTHLPLNAAQPSASITTQSERSEFSEGSHHSDQGLTRREKAGSFKET